MSKLINKNNRDLPKSNTNPNSKLKDPEGKLKNVDSKVIV